MGVLMRKHHGTILITGIARLAVTTLLVSLSLAFVDTVWAVYLESFFENASLVGFFSAFLSVLAFVFFFVFVPLIEKVNKVKLYFVSVFLSGVVYLVFFINRNFIIFVILSVIITALYSFRFTSFGIIVKDKSDKKNLSRNVALMFVFANISWVIGPLIAGLIFVEFGIPVIFLISSVFLFLAAFLFRISKIHDSNIERKINTRVFENFFEFFKDKDRVVTYILQAGVAFWWVLIYLYIPLLILESNINESWIGIFLFAVAVPLIIFEYSFAKLSEKYGSRKFFEAGFLILSFIALLSFFFSNIFVILSLLVLASVGVAMLEPTAESHFFDILKNKKEENRFYGPYNTSLEVGLVIGKIIPAIFLLFLPMKYIFPIFSVFMFLLFLVAKKSRNIVEKRKS
ncbi:MAG: MFS transporter [Nanoarchaeota archaeon]